MLVEKYTFSPQNVALRRILVIETLYLGDLVHTLPLIQALRARYPTAKLDVLVRTPHLALMRCVDGVNDVLVMDPRRHRSLGGLWSLVREVRARHYDLVLNPGASDRATLLTWLSGGKRRIGRLNRRQSRRLWPVLHDEVIDRRWAAEPMYWQKLTAFAPALGLSHDLQFGLFPPEAGRLTSHLPSCYLHLSPFASEDLRSLPPATSLQLLTALRHRYPELGLIVSSGPSARERSSLELLERLCEISGVVFLPGTLGLADLSAVIAGAALHVGPDSGPLHLAVALGTPALGCFLYKDASAEWMPTGSRYRTVGVTKAFTGGLYGLQVETMMLHIENLLATGQTRVLG